MNLMKEMVSSHTQKIKKPAANSRFSQLRILLLVHVSQEFLSLTENIKFRSSQLTRSGGTLAVSLAERRKPVEK